MSAPVARATRFKPTAARSRAGPSGSRVVTHREYVTDVAAATTPFAVSSSHVLNPGNSLLFPWLATIALRYETYRFLKLRFVYTARTSTSTAGSVIFTPDYDPNDPPPADLRAALTAGGSIESVPWKDLSISLPTSKLHADMPHKFTREVSNNVPSTSKYDAGIFRTATSGFIAEAGHLWVEYSVLLATPQMAPTVVGLPGSDTFHMSGVYNLNEGKLGDQSPTSNAQVPKTVYPGGWAETKGNGHATNKGNVTYDTASDTFTFQPGTYRVEYLVDTKTPGSTLAGNWYSFLQPFFTSQEGGGGAYLHNGPCESTSGVMTDVKGRFQYAFLSEIVTFLILATVQLGAYSIVGEVAPGTGGGATQSHIGGATRFTATRMSAAAA